jgi:hypothetical protein
MATPEARAINDPIMAARKFNSADWVADSPNCGYTPRYPNGISTA